MSSRRSLGGHDDETRKTRGLLSKIGRRKSESGTKDLIEQRKLLRTLTETPAVEGEHPASAESSDSDEESDTSSEVDEDDLRALEVAVASVPIVSISASTLSKTDKKESTKKKRVTRTRLESNFNETPYLQGNKVQASAFIQRGKKGASVDLGVLAEASDLYRSGPELTGNSPARENLKPPVTSGKNWFNLTATAMTEELKQDLRAVRMRSALDPKRFYKALDRPSKFVQLGTVIEGRGEYHSARLTRKERRTNLVEELMADEKARQYTKRKFNSIQTAKQNKTTFKPKKKGKIVKTIRK